jgi:hypothetical protein
VTTTGEMLDITRMFCHSACAVMRVRISSRFTLEHVRVGGESRRAVSHSYNPCCCWSTRKFPSCSQSTVVASTPSVFVVADTRYLVTPIELETAMPSQAENDKDREKQQSSDDSTRKQPTGERTGEENKPHTSGGAASQDKKFHPGGGPIMAIPDPAGGGRIKAEDGGRYLSLDISQL